MGEIPRWWQSCEEKILSNIHIIFVIYLEIFLTRKSQAKFAVLQREKVWKLPSCSNHIFLFISFFHAVPNMKNDEKRIIANFWFWLVICVLFISCCSSILVSDRCLFLLIVIWNSIQTLFFHPVYIHVIYIHSFLWILGYCTSCKRAIPELPDVFFWRILGGLWSKGVLKTTLDMRILSSFLIFPMGVGNLHLPAATIRNATTISRAAKRLHKECPACQHCKHVSWSW